MTTTEPCIFELSLCIDCVDAGECSGQRPLPIRQIESCCTPDDPCDIHSPCPVHTDLAAQTLRESAKGSDSHIWSQLECLKRQHKALKQAGRHTSARITLEHALGLVEGWFDSPTSSWLSGADDLDQLAAARAHVSATLNRWNREVEEGAPF